MAKLTIVKDLCKGCGLCADVCPKGLLALSKHINARGYHPIAIEEQEKCIGCASVSYTHLTLPTILRV